MAIPPDDKDIPGNEPAAVVDVTTSSVEDDAIDAQSMSDAASESMASPEDVPFDEERESFDQEVEDSEEGRD